MGIHRFAAVAVAAVVLGGAAGCTSLLGADGRYEEGGDGPGSSGSSSGSGGGAGGGGTVGATTGTAGTTTGAGGGEPCSEDFASGTSSASATGAGGGGECVLGTGTDCMACGHDCGPDATCLEGRCTATRVGAPADTVQALAIGGGYVHALEASAGTSSIFRFPVTSDSVFMRDAASASACRIDDCASRPMVADAEGTVYVGTPANGVFRCPFGQPCDSLPSVEGTAITGLVLQGEDLFFLRPSGSAPDLSSVSLLDGRATPLATLPNARGAVALTARGPDWFWTTSFLDGQPAGGLAKIQEGATATLASPESTGIASDGAALFWRAAGAVLKLSSGCTPEVLIAPAPGAFIEVDSTFVYFDYAGPAGRLVYRCPKEGLVGATPSASEGCDQLSLGGSANTLVGDPTWVVFGDGPGLFRVRKAP